MGIGIVISNNILYKTELPTVPWNKRSVMIYDLTNEE